MNTANCDLEVSEAVVVVSPPLVVNTRGIQLANKCALMAAIAYNLKKMMKFKSHRPIAQAMALLQPESTGHLSLFSLSYSR